MFDIPPPDPVANRYFEYCYGEWLRKHSVEFFHQVRRDIGDAFVQIDLVVLRPICNDCSGRDPFEALTRIRVTEPVFLIPEEIPGRFRFYDAAGRCMHFWPPDNGEEAWKIDCHICRERLSTPEGDDIIPVMPEPFEEYFGLPDQGPHNPPVVLREEIANLYGRRCFNCGVALNRDSWSIDHIVARTYGGETTPTNVQLLCRKCDNELKNGLPVKIVKLALDYKLRPAPSDSYPYPIW